jgi:hypothetical protein
LRKISPRKTPNSGLKKEKMVDTMARSMLDKIREVLPNKEDEGVLRQVYGIAPSPPPLPQDLEDSISSSRYQSKLARLRSQVTLPPQKKTGLGLLSLLNKMTHPNPDPKQFPPRSNSP